MKIKIKRPITFALMKKEYESQISVNNIEDISRFNI